MSAATGPALDVEDVKKVTDQMTQSFMSITNHIMGIYPNAADAQKSIDKVKALISKGFTDVRMENINCISLLFQIYFYFLIEFTLTDGNRS